MDRVAGITLIAALATALATACGGELAAEVPDVATDGEADASEDAAGPDVTVDVTTDGGSRDAPMDTRSDAVRDAPVDSSPEAPPHDASAVGAPRPIAPLSTATVTSQQPTLHWELAPTSDGAQVEICRDRACKQSVVTFLAPGTSGAPPMQLTAGVYFWRLHGTSNGGVGVASSPTWEMFVGALSAPVDTSWGSVPDFDSDGIADAVTGSPNTSDAGALSVYEGSPMQLTAVTTLGPPSGEASPRWFGQFLASAGDIDGDGFPEVLVTSGYDDVWMYRGGAMGLSTQAMLLIPSAANQNVFGASGVGDLDGDGYGDVAVAVYLNPSLGASITIYRGSATGLTASPNQLSSADWGFGRSFAPTDVNGDGYGDFVTAGYEGLYVFEGGPGGVRKTPVVIPFAQYASNGYFVSSAGDVNGDGYGDVVTVETIGHGSDSEALLYFGSAAGPRTQPLVTTDLGNNNGVGAAAGVGDINGDGYADYAMMGQYSPSGIYLALGGASGPSLVSNSWPLPTSASTIAFAAPGDVNGDGVDDVLVGDLGHDATYVYLGDRTKDLQMMPSQTLTGGGSPL
jgi:hypothetical protein